MVNSMRQSLYRLKPNKTLFMLCDIQEKFKPAIPLIGAVIENSKKLVSCTYLSSIETSLSFR